MLNIRRISHREKQIGEWQQRFQQDLAPHIPQVGERYFQITLNSEKQQIQVLVNAEDWCRHRWPKLAHYAWDLLDAKSLCKVFTYENTGNAFFSEQFRCHHVEIIDDEQPQQSWLTVKEKALGIVLLAEPISGLKEIKPINGLSDTLKLQADWILGYSHISGKTLQSIALRDVLRIQNLQLHMSVAGCLVAHFKKQQEGIFMIEQLVVAEDEQIDSAMEEEFVDETVRPFHLHDLTVKLTFVLGHSDITVGELDTLQPGTVYSIGENKEREVKVYANKQLIAEGELTYIGDSDELGLEIKRLVSLGDKRL
ncbi:FliM/FliN family flagellar motor switch protein [Providencia alcalifaciens]|uniref:Surface presentation of antigens protein n=1 Tax=Providencia alcalifaciens 205/92 TaxID=1256988 RepID=A0AAV3MB10_9GAMM|nr:FliM/FliN family flagellar motor switch protein [Providencia alcalifaciens]ETT09103.1 surface presentation of antigens protein [Providencia alcalifaciens F90-2004]EUC97615.1 surface presentation of antigens protein [Providencia alcalifaciens PAL-2]EUD12880.1 surface presentation of antigens protein [Providencia alcalifaciens 205/92]MTB31926.1 type III secretion protein [Providencia alcalifaciens]MTC16367.1 type III secretion protein [Providencia alcalifaciens]